MQLRSALLAATVLATPIAASAQPVTGLYVGGGVGVNITQQTNINGTSLGVPALLGGFASTNGNINGSTGFAGVLSVGWGFGNGLRAEIEGNYRNNNGEGFSNGTVTRFGATGSSHDQKYGGMFNVLYDFNGMTPWFVPYLGVGAGYLAINENLHANNTFGFTVPGAALGVADDQTFGPGTARTTANGTKGAFAYQAIIGAAFPLTTCAGSGIYGRVSFPRYDGEPFL